MWEHSGERSESHLVIILFSETTDIDTLYLPSAITTIVSGLLSDYPLQTITSLLIDLSNPAISQQSFVM